MEPIEFEWDDLKAEMNLVKHRVRFSEAVTIWFDEWSLEMADFDHSVHEERWIKIGMSSRSRSLVVVYTERSANSRIRIISARRATRSEEQHYFSRRV